MKRGKNSIKYIVGLMVVPGLFAGIVARGQNADFKGFPDVPKTHWAYAAVTELARKGILQGYPAEKRPGKLTSNAPNTVSPTTKARPAAKR